MLDNPLNFSLRIWESICFRGRRFFGCVGLRCRVAAVSGGGSLSRCVGSSLQWLLCCTAQALGAQAQ